MGITAETPPDKLDYSASEYHTYMLLKTVSTYTNTCHISPLYKSSVHESKGTRQVQSNTNQDNCPGCDSATRAAQQVAGLKSTTQHMHVVLPGVYRPWECVTMLSEVCLPLQ